jgi:hypothetical protein
LQALQFLRPDADIQEPQWNWYFVVCPSAALVAQLRREFKSEFWEKLGAPDIWRPDSVVQALPGSVDSLSEQLKKATGSA